MICPSCRAANDEEAESCFTCGQVFGAPGYVIAHGTVVAERYRILGTLGRGGIGVVYEAHDRVLDERVALKTLRPDVARDAEVARRFRSEIKLARRIRHRNVCAIHEYGEDGGLRYIAMELVDGVDLRQVMERHGRLASAMAVDVTLQVADGLRAIHDAGVIHRDLKPRNIMLDAGGRIRLMDFGVAKQAGAETTVGGQVVGTPEYMSPEQARGHKVDFRSDIYTLAIVMYELFTGRPPFRADTPIGTMLKQLHDPPPLDGPAAEHLPTGLIPILRRALQKDPADRYATVRDLKHALEGALVELASGEGRAELARLGATSPRRREAPPASALVMAPTTPRPPARAAESHPPVAANAAEPVVGATTVSEVRPATPVPAHKVGRRAWPLLVATAGVALGVALARVFLLPTQPPLPAPAATLAPPATQRSPLPEAAPPEAAEPTPVRAAPPTAERTPTRHVPTPAPIVPAAAPTPSPTPAPRGTPTPTPMPVPSREAAAAEESQRDSAARKAPPERLPTPPPTRPGQLVEAGPGVDPPKLLKPPRPVYPSLAKRLKRSARILVRLLVDETGRVVEAEVVEGDPSELGFNEAAVDSALRATFRPATKDGVPVKMWVSLSIDFTPP